MTTETKADDFKTGDVVWCLVFGKGKVGDILKDDLTYPIEVLFDNGGANWYTKEGSFSEEGNRTLFFSEPKIEASITRPFVPTLVGKRVVIQYKDGSYFAEHAVVTGETSTHISSDDDLWPKKDIEAIYEVSSENLLKP